MSSQLSSGGINNAIVTRHNTHPGSGTSKTGHRTTSRVGASRPGENPVVEHGKRQTAVCDENCLECVRLREKQPQASNQSTNLQYA